VSHPEQPSYEQLAALVAELLALVAQQGSLIESLQAEVAALRRTAGRDSSNSSQPPSQDGPAAKAKAGKREARRARPGRSQGGQKGHPGTGLERVAVPDETRVLEPEACAGCGGDLAGAPGQISSSVQVFDIPAIALRVTEYLMMRRSCGCGHVTTAPAPPGVRGGPACYGPNAVAAATLLASADVIGIERAADLMSTLLGAPVPAGFVSRCLVRLDDALQAAGFEEALKDALKAADVLGTDESPAPLTNEATGQGGLRQPARVHGAHHARIHRRRGGSGLVRRGRQPHQALHHRLRDPRRLPRGPGP
jgi:transposase